MLSIKNLTYKIGDRVLFDNASITFTENQNYAVTGVNGAGKSTLFKIIAGDIVDFEGIISKKGKISILRQNLTDAQREMTLVDFITQGHEDLWKNIEMRNNLYMKEFTEEVGMKIAECEENIADLGGYTIENDIEKMMDKIGTTPDIIYKKVKEISNSDVMKSALIRALISKPSILLLDEPTNGIDIFAIEWLKKFIKETFKGMVLFISHDVDFVNSLATSVADVDYKDIILYPGNFDNMMDMKRSIREASEKEQLTIKKKADKIKSFISKFGAGTRASQAKSKAKQLEKLDSSSMRKSNVVAPYIMFDFGEAPSSIVMNIEGINKKMDTGEKLVEDFSLRVEKGDKIAILGKNGSGKSLLVKVLADIVEKDSGKISLGSRVKVGYFPQYHTEILNEYNKDMTVIDWVSSGLDSSESVRSVLGRMLFGGDDVKKKMSSLSGGETVRAILAKTILDGSNVIILDEPCSHLDLGAVVSLKHAIEVSRDKTFIIATNSSLHDICNKKIIFEEKEKNPFIHMGSFEDYQNKRKQKK